MGPKLIGQILLEAKPTSGPGLTAELLQQGLEVQAAEGGEPAGLAKFAKVGVLFGGAAEKGEAWNCDFLVDKLREWTAILELPRLGAYGITAADLERILDKTSNRHNPVKLDRQELRELLSRRL